MSENIGFISLHRSLREWQWYSKPNMVAVWIELLLTANFKDNYYDGKLIKKGQIIFGRKKFADRIGLSEQQIRTCINRLKSTNEITIETTNKYSVITIVNWAYYQSFFIDSNQQNNQVYNQQSTSKQPTSNQQVTNNQPHYNKDNKANKVNKDNNIPSNLDSSINTKTADLIAKEFKRELTKEEHSQVIAMCKFYEPKLVEYALRECIIYEQLNFGYLVQILKRWRADGMTAEKYEAGQT